MASAKDSQPDTKSSSVTIKPKQPQINLADSVVKSVFSQPETYCGREYVTSQITIELGRRQTMWLAAASSVDGKHKAHDQITIRDIRLHPDIQRKGILKALVKRILELTGGVQLEAIENEWLLAAVDKSPLWKPQSLYDKGQLHTTYSRVGKPDPNTPFVLF